MESERVGPMSNFISGEKRPSFSYKRTLSPLLSKDSRLERMSRNSQMWKGDLLQMSTDIISFCYKGGHSQYVYNRELKLMNKTGARVAFKIKSNNPQNYQVSPSQQKLDDGSGCQIRFRLFIQNGNISKYWTDVFLLQWGTLDDLTGQPIYSLKAHLKVKVVSDINNAKVQAVNNSICVSQKDIQFYKKLIRANRQKIHKLDNQIEESEKVPKQWVISYSLGAFLVVLSFVIGYLIY